MTVCYRALPKQISMEKKPYSNQLVRVEGYLSRFLQVNLIFLDIFVSWRETTRKKLKALPDCTARSDLQQLGRGGGLREGGGRL